VSATAYFHPTLINPLHRTLDYIFISSECSVLSAEVYPAGAQTESSVDSSPTGSLQISPSNGPFPNASWPSDHLLVDVCLTYDLAADAN
jgi:hypothetical protein